MVCNCSSIKALLIALLLWSGVAQAAPLRVTVHLKPNDPVALDELVKEQQTPGSANYHRWLKTGEFDRRFAHSKQVEQQVASWLTSAGCTIHKQTHRFVQATCPGPLMVPANLRGVVAGIVDHLHQPKASAQVRACTPFCSTLTAMGPYDLYNAYNVPYPVRNGGVGQTICVIAGSDVNAAIYPLFDVTFGLPSINFQRRLDGANPGLGDDTGEAELDTQVVHEMAPNAEILMYLGDVSVTQLIQDAVTDNICSVINVSFEDAGTGQHSALEPIYAEGAAQGQTIVVANGDYFAGQINDYSIDPNVLAVGGTDGISGPTYPSPSYINPRPYSETVYYNGGASSYPKPSWQTGTGVPADGARDVPDVSGYALSGKYLYVDYDGTYVAFSDAGGTSASGPFWAGLTALLVQNVGQRLGNLNPIIYPIANRRIGFFDVTTGSVGAYCSANVGFDLCTGWGTPNFGALSRAVQQQFWSGQGGPF